MKKPFILINAIFLSLNLLIAQKNTDLVNKYTNLYPKDDFVIENSTTSIQFEPDPKNETVIVYETKKYNIISLKPFSYSRLSFFYDNNTSITASGLDVTYGDYTPSGEFHSDLKKCVIGTNFKNSGEIKTISIKRKYSDIRFFSEIAFTDQHYPILKSNVIFEIPEGLDITIKNFNTQGYNYTKENPIKKGNITTYTYSCKNIPIYYDEVDFPPRNYYVPLLAINAKMFQSNSKQISLFGGLDQFYSWCKQKTTLIKNDTQPMEETIKSLTGNKKTDIDKIKSIYYWVQDNIRYIAFEEGLAGFVPDDAQKVFKNKYGDCKGMANLLKTMLVAAGYDARLTWIGTNDLRFDFSIPNFLSSNHMVCALFYNNKHYILDATDKYNPFGYYSESISGRPALIENGEKYILDTVPAMAYKENMVVNKMLFTVNDDLLKGSITLNFDGDFRSSIMSGYHYSRSEKQEEYLTNIIDRGLNKVKTNQVTATGLNNRDTTLVLKASLEIKGLVTSFDNEMMVSPDPYSDYSNLEVADARALPFYIESREIRKTISKVKIPTGFKLKQLPENTKISNNKLDFSISYTKEPGYIVYTKEICVKTHFIPVEDLDSWKKTIKQIKNDTKAPIEFIKI
jgi:hypothetical protein